MASQGADNLIEGDEGIIPLIKETRGKKGCTMKWQVRRMAPGLIGFIVLCVGVFGLAQAAAAVVLQISAVGFVLRCESGFDCPDSGSSAFGDESQGLLLNAEGRYFAPVMFHASNMNVCKFTLKFRDNDADINVTARLKRKIATGTDAFAPPVVMAEVSSSGANNNLRQVSDSTITNPLVNTGGFFYFVEIEVPGNTLEVLGVQIDYRSTCP